MHGSDKNEIGSFLAFLSSVSTSLNLAFATILHSTINRQSGMDYQSSITFIHNQCLDMVEMLDELKEQLLDTLNYLETDPATPDWSSVICNYLSVRDDTLKMIAVFDVLENALINRYQNK